MQSIRNWWGRYSLQVIVVGLGLGAAWAMRQTQGAVFMEAYQLLNQPFKSEYTNRELLENAQVKELQYRITEIETQNQYLRNILKAKPISSIAGIWSGVIGRSSDSWWQQLVVDKGRNQGIKVGAIAIGATMQVGVMISRTRNMGIMRGQDQNLGILSFFERDPNVKPGDIVVTSPHSGLFPPGIPVGKVRSINLNRQPAPEAIIEFSVPLGQLEYVRVDPFAPAE
jgi:rod shape-determining protein MreC